MTNRTLTDVIVYCRFDCMNYMGKVGSDKVKLGGKKAWRIVLQLLVRPKGIHMGNVSSKRILLTATTLGLLVVYSTIIFAQDAPPPAQKRY